MLKSSKISYSHIYVWRSCTEPPNLNPLYILAIVILSSTTKFNFPSYNNMVFNILTEWWRLFFDFFLCFDFLLLSCSESDDRPTEGDLEWCLRLRLWDFSLMGEPPSSSDSDEMDFDLDRLCFRLLLCECLCLCLWSSFFSDLSDFSDLSTFSDFCDFSPFSLSLSFPFTSLSEGWGQRRNFLDYQLTYTCIP